MTKMSIRTARDLVYERSGGRCERCGIRPGANWHHRRAAGRLWTPENGLHLCGSGTTGCHGWVTEEPNLSRDWGWSVSNYAQPIDQPVVRFGVWVMLHRDGGLHPVELPLPGDFRELITRPSSVRGRCR